ncbi:MAG: HEAT repeat domain-containing protein [Geobacteraceae bacterium]|nr:HEAT repeat domain-containing protein [Geobacteraceae bacterium]
MARFARIDTSLSQRSDLLRLFHTLEREDISLDEMEMIASEVQKAGLPALPPLLRRLRKVTGSSIIARYLYLLDFFEDGSWIDELVRITLKRKDLEVDAKTVLLAGLERSGVDIEELPFSRLLEEVGSSSPAGLDALLDRGEAGFVSFMENFVGYSSEAQVALVRLLATRTGPEAELFLEILLGYSDDEIVTEVIISLGRIRRQSAANVILRYLQHADGAFRVLAERSLKRLSFLGILPEPEDVPLDDTPFHLAAASPIEGSGFRSLWFSRWNHKGGLDVFILQTHETCGITDAAGYGDLNPTGHDELFREAVLGESLLKISPDYAHALLRDALYLNIDKGFPVPPEFYVWRRILQTGKTRPEPFVPDFSTFNLDDITASTFLFETGDTLLDEECFAGWFPATGRVFDIADELAELQEDETSGLSEKNLADLLMQFMQEVITPEKNRIARRLFLIADLMLRTGKERELVERILAAALHLMNEDVPYLKNPFLRRFALDSLSFARDALADGYDPRQNDLEWGDDELWD